MTKKALLTFTAILTVYLLTLAPDLTWAHFGGDGGDLITAAVTFGTPHPMGYPTYTLLGWLWQWMPVGTVAWRFNLFSAVCMAGAAAILIQICHISNNWDVSSDKQSSLGGMFQALQISQHAFAAVGAALLFAFSPLIWQQAIITEVYALNLLVLSSLLWAILTGKSPLLIGVLWGLSLTTHLTSLLFAPLVFSSQLPHDIRLFGKSWDLNWVNRSANSIARAHDARHTTHDANPKKSNMLMLFAGLAIGVLPFAVLPILANGNSAVVWGDATTFEGWFWLVSGRIYRPNLLNHNPISRLIADPQLLLRQFAYIGWLPVLAGIWQTRRQTWLLTVTALLYLVYAYTYDTSDYYVFALPALLLLSILLAAGLRQIGWMSLALPILAIALNFSAISLHGDRAVRTRADQLLAQLPADAIALTQGDQTIFALWYFQEVEHSRPDVIAVDANLLAFDWYRERLQRQHPDVQGLDVDDIGAFVTQNRAQRRVCFATIDPELSVQCQ